MAVMYVFFCVLHLESEKNVTNKLFFMLTARPGQTVHRT